MAFYYPITTGRIRGKSRIWDIVISERYDTEQDPAPTSTATRFRKQLRFQYSNPSGGDLQKGVMPSFVQLDFVDLGYRLYDAMKARVQTGSVDRAFRVDCQSRDLSWSGYAQLDQIEKYVWTNKRLPVTSVQFADGIADLDDIEDPGFYFGVSIHGLLRNPLAYDLHEKDIEYRFRWVPTNRETGEPQITRIWPFNVWSDFTPAGRVKDISDQFFFRVWQGLDNRWHVEQAPLIGKEIALGGGTEYFAWQAYDPLRDEDTEVVDIAGARRVVNVSSRRGEAELRELLDKAAGSVRYSTEEEISLYYFQFARDGWFRYWADANTPWLYQTAGTIVQDTRFLADQYAANLQGSAARLRQDFQAIGADQDVSLKWDFWAAIEGPTTNNFDFEIAIEPIHAGDSKYYLQSDGTWTTTPTVLNSGAIAVVPMGNPTLTYTEIFVRNVEPIPVAGYPYIEWRGIDGSHNVIIDDYWLTPVDTDGEIVQDIKFETVFVTPYPNAERSREVKISRDWLQRESRGFSFTGYVNINPNIQVWNNALAINMPVDGWEDLSDPGVVYYDLSHLSAVRGWFEQLPYAPVRFRGRINAIAPPEYSVIIDGVECIAMNVTVDGVTETTEGEWTQNIRANEDLT